GAHAESPTGAGPLRSAPGAMSLVDGGPPLEVRLRAKAFFEFMERILIGSRLGNLLDISVHVDARFNPEHGGVTVFIRQPSGRIVQYAPILCKLAEKVSVKLDSGQGEKVPGEDRFSQEVFLSYGQGGFYFEHPGEYLIRAVYQGLGDVLIPS